MSFLTKYEKKIKLNVLKGGGEASSRISNHNDG
jgi:hypothetical protein